MPRLQALRPLLLGLAVSLLAGIAVQAAEIDVSSDDVVRPAPRARVSASCPRVEICANGVCELRRVCPRRCPDGYSCAPLYGAYGPYGGVGYWAGYTYSGWGAR